MANNHKNLKADFNKDFSKRPQGPGFDRGENTSIMEPLVLPADTSKRINLNDLALELAAQAAGFNSSLPAPISESLSDLVRAMNCYYSNLIEGHSTHPVDIEKALNNDYSSDKKKRDLQLEAKAHIEVQRWIDHGGLMGRSTRIESILETHRRFCDLLPEELLWVDDPTTKKKYKLIGGELRQKDVQVGAHIAISPGRVPYFLQRYEEVYASLGRSELLLALAIAHHRLVWIHPFLDGNGRVARLMTHASFLEVLKTKSLWSVARGLAKNVDKYKQLLHNCDLLRRNDLDGRGNLSTEALVEFSEFFLETCLDQIRFMKKLVQPQEIQGRILIWANEEIQMGRLLPKSDAILKTILFRGELLRKELPEVTGVGERQSRRIVAALTKLGVIKTAGTKAPLHLAFTAVLASRWLPGLFPDKAD